MGKRRDGTSAQKLKGGTPAGNKGSGTSNYLRRPGYKKLDEAGSIRPGKKKGK